MRELEPVGKFRVFVPEAGDAVLVCPGCGRQEGMVSAVVITSEDLADEREIVVGLSRCCDVQVEPRLL